MDIRGSSPAPAKTLPRVGVRGLPAAAEIVPRLRRGVAFGGREGVMRRVVGWPRRANPNPLSRAAPEAAADGAARRATFCYLRVEQLA